MKKITLIFLVLLSLFSCRSVKKEWVKENFTEKAEISQLKENYSNLKNTLKTEINEALILEINEKLKQEKVSESSSENESTTVSGSITAEDGKEKSVTIGGTTIKSNGANVTFETSSTKEFTRKYESKLEELQMQLEKKTITIKELHSEINSLKSEFSIFRSNYESEKTAKSKEVKSSGLSFGFWLTIIIVTIVIIIIWYFRKSIPFLK